MAKYRDASCKLCRREGEKLFLKGSRCYSAKCAVEKRPYVPGQHGQRRSKLSDYGVHLRAKQKLRRIYGIMERQFRSLFDKADKMKGVTGDNFLRLLETRLDSIVFLMGFANTRNQARQLVCHGHIKVNGRKVNIPSYLVKINDVVAIAEKSREVAAVKEALEMPHGRIRPDWLRCDAEAMTGRIERLPKRDDIKVSVDEQLIVEFYSR